MVTIKSHYSFNSTSNLVSVGNTSVYRAFDSCAAGPMVGPIVSLGLDTAFLKYANNVLKEIVGSALMYLMQQDEPNPNKIACHMYAKRMIQNKLQYGPLMGSAKYAFLLENQFLKNPYLFSTKIIQDTKRRRIRQLPFFKHDFWSYRCADALFV